MRNGGWGHLLDRGEAYFLFIAAQFAFGAEQINPNIAKLGNRPGREVRQSAASFAVRYQISVYGDTYIVRASALNALRDAGSR
jgi:hypothetical protein